MEIDQEQQLQTRISSNLLEKHAFAAIDLGSNSFHMIVSRYVAGEFVVIDRYKQVVRLVAGLNQEGELDSHTRGLALSSLERIRLRLDSLRPHQVRAVGTNAFRRLCANSSFVSEAEIALGKPIDVLQGREEARLIYVGVANFLRNKPERRLVIDIGGGSTELILGAGTTPRHLESFNIGCIVLSNQHFNEGNLSRHNFDSAIAAVRAVLRPLVNLPILNEWTAAIGCSGTVRCVSNVLISNGWSEQGITKRGLDKLRAEMVNSGSTRRLLLRGLPGDRIEILAGGLSILIALFEIFEISEMSVLDVALREGVLYDLLENIEP